MLKIKGTASEFDKLINSFNDVFEETIGEIDLVDLSDKTKQHLKDMVKKDLIIVASELENIFELEYPTNDEIIQNLEEVTNE